MASKLRKRIGSLHRAIRVRLAAPVNPAKWVFVVGCYNSGTTLLAQLLGLHPRIAPLPNEGQYLTDELVKDFRVGIPRMWCQREDLFRWTEDRDGPDPKRIKREWAIRLPTDPEIVLEKTPANIARMRWLQAHFAPAYFIAITRNGYAVAEGIRRKADPPGLPEGWPIGMCARQWRRCCEVMEEDAPHLEHFHHVRYEALASEPAATLAGICDFLGLRAELDLPDGSAWKIHEREEPIRNMNGESFSRLSPSDIEAIDKEAGPMLARYGYLPPAMRAAT